MAVQNLELLTDLISIKCSLCLDIFERPRRISCGHVFCAKCLEPFVTMTAPQCPNCRQFFDARKHQPDKRTEQTLLTHCGQCEGCSKQFPLLQLRNHTTVCDKMAAIEKLRIEQTKVDEPRIAVPNRATFQCPYCGVKNLESQSLVQHCTQQHGRDPRPVVCPVCTSMPWGNSNLASSNFIRHLNMRHKFEYDTYVDYQQDDDAMLRAALQASLQQQ
jgi:hypothetical protein